MSTQYITPVWVFRSILHHPLGQHGMALLTDEPTLWCQSVSPLTTTAPWAVFGRKRKLSDALTLASAGNDAP
jgi:hypothetical protein